MQRDAARSARLHPRCCVAAGSGQAVLPAAVPGLAGLAGARGCSLQLMKRFRPRSQNNFDILGKERDLAWHCAWLAKLLLTTCIEVDGSQSASLYYLFLIQTYCQQAISQISWKDSVCACCVVFEL